MMSLMSTEECDEIPNLLIFRLRVSVVSEVIFAVGLSVGLFLLLHLLNPPLHLLSTQF